MPRLNVPSTGPCLLESLPSSHGSVGSTSVSSWWWMSFGTSFSVPSSSEYVGSTSTTRSPNRVSTSKPSTIPSEPVSHDSKMNCSMWWL